MSNTRLHFMHGLRPLLLLTGLSVVGMAAVPADAADMESGFDISGSVRARGETVAGQARARLPENESMFTLRTLVKAEYATGPVRFVGELLDARGYGEKEPLSAATTGDIDPLELLQGYVGVDLHDAFGAGSEASVKAGRFTMELGAGRLVARPGFVQAPPAFTGVSGEWANQKGDTVFAFWTMPHRKRPDDLPSMRKNKVERDLESTDLQFFGVHAAKADLIGKVAAELYIFGLNENDGPSYLSRNRRLTTPGVRLSKAPAQGAWDFDVEGAYQFGSVRGSSAANDFRRLSVSAHFAHAEIGRKLPGKWTPRVSVHFDEASGDGPDAGTFGRFDALYGSRRTDFGPTGLYGEVSRANLLSAGLRLEAKPSKQLDFFIMGRELWLDEATDSFGATGVRDRSGNSGRHAGSQLEARVRYWVVPKKYRVELGGAYLARGTFLKEAPNANDYGDTRYAFLDLVGEY